MHCALLILALLGLSAGACSGDQRSPTGGGPPASASPAPSPCPSAPAAQPWPATVPAEMPVPPGLQVLATRRAGVSDEVSFRSSQSIKQAAVFLATRLPAAGFPLRGGDSEANEVDQPFTGHGRRGTFKLHSTAPCTVRGVLVISLPG